LVFAILLILAGAALFLDNLGLWHIRAFWKYWPLALIAVGASKLFSTRGPAGGVWAALILIAGTSFLLRNLGVLNVGFGIIWPLILVGFGILMLLRVLERRSLPAGFAVSTTNALREWVVFGAAKPRLDTQDFQGGELLAVFGEVQVDLRRAGVVRDHKEVTIDANATFGAIEIKIPETWSVTLRGVGIFGAYEDKTIPPHRENAGEAPKLVITGYAVFGAVTVHN